MAVAVTCHYCKLQIGQMGHYTATARQLVRHIELFHREKWEKFLKEPKAYPLVCSCGWLCFTDRRTFSKHVNHHVQGSIRAVMSHMTQNHHIDRHYDGYTETDRCQDEADVNVSNNETLIPTDMDVHMGDDVCDNADADISADDRNQLDSITLAENLQNTPTSSSAVHRYIMDLYTKGPITTKTIQMSVSATQSLLTSTVQKHRNEFTELLQELQPTLKATLKPKIDHINTSFDESLQLFSGFETEHQRMKYLRSLGLVLPVTYTIGTHYTTKSNGERVLSDATAEYVPIIDTLLYYVDKKPNHPDTRPGILQSFLDTESYRSSDYYKNHPEAFQLTLYHDDIEVANVLGSRAGVHKLTMFYVAVSGFITGKLANIHLVSVCHASDLSRFGYGPILKPLMADLEALSIGEPVILNDGTSKLIHARLQHIAADNLAANQIIGINRSFSKGHFCRFCYAHSEECAYMTRANMSIVRSAVSHQMDVECVEADSTFSKRTGVRERSSLDTLSYFSAIENTVPDVMHDILEGIGPKEVRLVLQRLVAEKLISLDELNDRLVSFNYGSQEVRNRPSAQLSLDNIKQTASQMWCLLRFLPQLIGHKVPVDHPAWGVLLRLRTIMDIVFSPSVSYRATFTLAGVIEDHHSSYLEIFPEEKLTAKAHWLLHYPDLIRRFGPLIHHWCMRYEGKHRLAKAVTSVSCNFMNVPKTVAKRYQVKEHAERDSEEGITPPIIAVGDTIVVGLCQRTLEPVFGYVDEIHGIEFRCRVYSTIYNAHFHAYDIDFLSDEVITVTNLLYRRPASVVRTALHRQQIVLRHAVV